MKRTNPSPCSPRPARVSPWPWARIAAHKLRSALTLLGVLVGVFSIIVVMTAMRVMQSNIERQLSSLGSQTFMVRKWPGTYFGVSSGDLEKYWRRKNITLRRRANGLRKRPRCRPTSAWKPPSGPAKSRPATKPARRPCGSTAKRPAVFPRTTGSRPRAGCWWTPTWTARATSACSATAWPRIFFPTARPSANRSRLTASITPSSACWKPKGGALGGDQDNFVVVPLTTGLNRYGRWWRSLNILVQARDRATYDATVEEVRGIMRVIRKVPPGQGGRF